jgi:hypothetical protein
MDIRNDTELQTAMLTSAEEALELITQEVIRIFRNDYILKYAYIDNPAEYERTNEFYDAWDWSEIKRGLKSLATELWYNPEKIQTFDAERFIHGSVYSTPNFVGANLPAILEGKQSSLWLSVPRPVKFWEKFIEDMLDNGQLEKIISKHFLSKGFTRI